MSFVKVFGLVAYATVVCATPAELPRRLHRHARANIVARSPEESDPSLCVAECKVAVPDVTQYEWQPLPAASTRVVETVTVIVDPQNPTARSTSISKNYPPEDPDGTKNRRLVKDGVAYTTLALPGTVLNVQFPTPVTIIPTVVTQIGDLAPGSVGPGCTAAPIFEKTLKLAAGASPIKFGSNPALAANPDKESWHLVPRVTPENPLDWRTLFAKDPVLDTCHLFAKRPAAEIAAAKVAEAAGGLAGVKYITTTITSTKAGPAPTPAPQPAPAPVEHVHQAAPTAPTASAPAFDLGVKSSEKSPTDTAPSVDPILVPAQPVAAQPPAPEEPAPDHQPTAPSPKVVPNFPGLSPPKNDPQPPAAPAPVPEAPAVDPTTEHPFGVHTNPGPPPAAAAPAADASPFGVHTRPGPPPDTAVVPSTVQDIPLAQIINADPSFATAASAPPPAPPTEHHHQDSPSVPVAVAAVGPPAPAAAAPAPVGHSAHQAAAAPAPAPVDHIAHQAPPAPAAPAPAPVDHSAHSAPAVPVAPVAPVAAPADHSQHAPAAAPAPAPAPVDHSQHAAPAGAALPAAPAPAPANAAPPMDHAHMQHGGSTAPAPAPALANHAQHEPTESMPGGLVDPEDLPEAPTGLTGDEAEHEAQFGPSHGLDLDDHGGMFMAPMSAGAPSEGGSNAHSAHVAAGGAPAAAGDAHSAHVASGDAPAAGADAHSAHMASGDASTAGADAHSAHAAGGSPDSQILATEGDAHSHMGGDDASGAEGTDESGPLLPPSAQAGHHHHSSGGSSSSSSTYPGTGTGSDPQSGVVTVVPGPASAAKTSNLSSFEGGAGRGTALSAVAVGVAVVAGFAGVVAGL